MAAFLAEKTMGRIAMGWFLLCAGGMKFGVPYVVTYQNYIHEDVARMNRRRHVEESRSPRFFLVRFGYSSVADSQSTWTVR